MRTEYAEEVLHAVFGAIRVNQTLISRRKIEQHILEHPNVYPVLSSQASSFRRTTISSVMNSRFSRWIVGRGVSQNNFVWKVRDSLEDAV